MPGRILIDQEKYILENVFPMTLNLKSDHGRREKTDPLNHSEFEQFRSGISKLNWVGRESRPEVCGVASLLAQELKDATLEHAQLYNKAVKFLRSTASQTWTIWEHDPVNMKVVSVSDSGGISGDSGKVQNASMVLISDESVAAGKNLRVSPLAWRSCKCRRVVNSSLAAEIQAASMGLAEAQ